MEIRDVIHGAITIEPHELPIVDSRFFQRLRLIRQLGFGEHSFPSATHNRYIHSLGAMHTATRAFDSIFSPSGEKSGFTLPKQAFERLRAVARLAALLHDVGHGPLSHTTEVAMPPVAGPRSRKATHEDYTLKIIQSSSLTPDLQRAGRRFGIKPQHIAALIDPALEITDDFFKERINGTTVNFRPILQQLISSELDADRMDYLRRDSLHAGVSYGQFDYDWILTNLTAHVEGGKCYLALEHRALYSFEDFLISRFHMFLMVYFHHKAVVYDEMLIRYFSSPECNYRIPSDIEAYCDYNDSHLYSHLAESKSEWAQRIVQKRPYRVLIELHSGIPATKTATTEQNRLLGKIERDLKTRTIPYLTSTSTGELSKYFRKPGDPIYVRYDNHFSAPSLIPLQQCTDLFQRYSEKRSITRIYVSPEDYRKFKAEGRSAPLRYQDFEGDLENKVSNLS